MLVNRMKKDTFNNVSKLTSSNMTNGKPVEFNGDSVKEFFKRLDTDESLQSKFSNIKDLDIFLSFVRNYSHSHFITKDQLIRKVKKLLKEEQDFKRLSQNTCMKITTSDGYPISIAGLKGVPLNTPSLGVFGIAHISTELRLLVNKHH